MEFFWQVTGAGVGILALAAFFTILFNDTVKFKLSIKRESTVPDDSEPPAPPTSHVAMATMTFAIDASQADLDAQRRGLALRAIATPPAENQRGRGVVWDGTPEQAHAIAQWLSDYDIDATLVQDGGSPVIRIPSEPDCDLPAGLADVRQGQAIVMTDNGQVTRIYPLEDFGPGFITSDLTIRPRVTGAVRVTESLELPCDRECYAEGSPMEDCSVHGRTPRELWDIIHELNEERARVSQLLRQIDNPGQQQ